MIRQEMPATLDCEVSSRASDAFGHRHFADALRSLIESPTLTPPYSIGLLGGWGTGKSTIKALYLSDLNEDDTGKPKRRESIRAVTFNAWRYGENVKRALLRQVYLELGGNETTLKEALFEETRRLVNKRRPFKERLFEFFDTFSVPGFFILVFMAVVFGLTWLGTSWLGLSSVEFKSAVSTAITSVAGLIFRQLKIVAPSSFLPTVKITTPTASAEEFQDLLNQQLHEYKKGKGAKCERLVVFVDDLDRLSSEEMVQGLDAIRSFMEIPQTSLPNDLGIVFVISCDEERIAHALEEDRHQDDTPGSVFTRTDARRYLDRIFQFRLEIPPFPRRDMRQYAISKLESLSLPPTNVSTDRIVEKMIHVGVQSPRNALQIVNAFSQSWWIAHRREHSEAGTDRPGVLHEGAVSKHPLTLAVLCAIRVDFPDFYDDLQNNPDLIHRFNDIVSGRQPLNSLPAPTREVLDKYFDRSRSDESKHAGDIVRIAHRPLRRFLASLRNHRWPKAIQPLLFLSEDPISRKFGDGKQKIWEALISGDTAGVLEVLDRGTDSTPLRSEDVQLLKDMTEDLNREEESRRIAACAVIASLFHRMPPESARALAVPLVRQLEDSPILRWSLGIPRIGELLSVAEPAEKRGISTAIIQDVLRTKEPMDFRLESQERPSLEEAKQIAQDALQCVLTVRNDCGLTLSSSALLRQWLLKPLVSVTESDAFEFSFTDIQSWIVDGNTSLLPELSHDYVDLLISELETQSTTETNFDIEEALKFAEQIFDQLNRAGEESRPILWSQLAQLSALKHQKAVELAWQAATKFQTSDTPEYVSVFIASLAGRLTKEMRDNDDWKLDWNSGAQALLALVETRYSALSENALDAYRTLVTEWGEINETSEYAIRGLQSLSGERKTAVLTAWFPKILGDLPDACADKVASLYCDFDSSQQKAIETQLNIALSPGITLEQGKKYQRFITRLPDDAWATTPMQTHIETLIPALKANHNNASGYLFSVFPAAVQILHFANAAKVGAMLHGLFQSAKGQPNHYGYLHGFMVGHWPESTPENAPYDPNSIFDDAYQFATTNPAAKYVSHVLRSMKALIDGELVTETKTGRVIQAACVVWASSPSSALKQMLVFETPLSPKQTADLITSVDWDDEEIVNGLQATWQYHKQLQSLEQKLETTILIVRKGAQGADDQALRIWLDTEAEPTLLNAAFGADDNTDDGRRRLWTYVTNSSLEFGQQFFLDNITRLLGLPENEETAQAIFNSKNILESLFSDADSKAMLSKALLEEVFPVAPTTTIKGETAAWVKELGGRAFVRNLDTANLSLNDIDLLTQHFGKNVTKKLNRKLEKQTQ